MNKELNEKIKKEGDSHKWIHITRNGLSVTCSWKRNTSLGMLCGYVSLSPTNKLHNCDELNNISVHGGITYTAIISGDDEIFEKNYYVIGFDCGHSGDLIPYMIHSLITPASTDEYRDKEYVESECISLAEQISKYDIMTIRRGKLKNY